MKKNNDFILKNLNNILNIIKYPSLSDKATRLFKQNRYTFIVDKRANKFTIKKIIEYLFNVHIIKINTLKIPKNKNKLLKYNNNSKKALITIKYINILNLFPEM